MLEIINLSKNYGDHQALNGLNMTVQKGELFGFVGSNGAGKTTTMKICVGLLKGDSGKVLIDGTDALTKENKKKIGYVPDFFGVYDNLTAKEYLVFFAGAHGIWDEAANELADNLLELVNLSDKADSQVDGLSRGMKQRLCLARALVSNPEILFLDEPASGLDPKARHELKEILKNLAAMGKSVIISSHILPELIEMCDRIGIISHGKLLFCGNIEDAIKLQKGRIVVKLTALSSLSEAETLFKQVPEISDIVIEGDVLNFSVEGDEKIDAEVIKMLVNGGVQLTSYVRSGENAESVLLDIMEG